MNRLTPNIHGVLDYATVLFLFISPSLFTMSEPAQYFTYTLGTVHLLLTIFTNFELGLIRIVPLKLHGWIELIVAIALIAVAFYFRNSGDALAFYYYLIFAIVLFAVWILSDYSAMFKKTV